MANRVIVAAPDDDLVLTETITSAKEVEYCATLTSREEVIPSIKYYQPQVCLLSSDLPGKTDVLDIAEKLTESNIRIVFLAGDLAPDNPTIERLQRMGITDILYGIPTAGLLIERLNNQGNPVTKSDLTIQPDERHLTEREPEASVRSIVTKNFRKVTRIRKNQGQHLQGVTALWSPAPTGKSFVAFNMAVALSTQGIDTVIIDLSPDHGIWALSGAPNNEDGLQKALESPDMAIGAAFKLDIVPSLYVLTMDPVTEQPVTFSVSAIKKLTESLINKGLTVIYDLGQEIRGLKDIAKTIVLVCDHDYNHLIKTQKAIMQEEEWLDRAVAILNRHTESEHLSLEKVRQETGNMNIKHIIPEITTSALECQRLGIPAIMVNQELMQIFMVLSSDLYRYSVLGARQCHY